MIETWKKAINEVFGFDLPNKNLDVLAQQTKDSISRIQIYKAYKRRALNADENGLSYYQSYVPFVLSQRSSIKSKEKVWLLFLATYFGKSNSSKWELFKRSAFDNSKNLISYSSIEGDREKYFNHLRSFDFYKNANYSNHRKFIAKKLDGDKGFIRSANFLMDNIEDYIFDHPEKFDIVYNSALKIPNFGRMGAFDFTSSLCKCACNVLEPTDLYLKNSTGPLIGIGELLKIGEIENQSKKDKVKLGNDLLVWFIANTNIFMCAQVLEDAICNWQKSPAKYKKYFG